MIYPDFPIPGDVIGICAPSAGVGHKLESFDLSLERIGELGYDIYETDSVRVEDSRSAEADVRGDEFNQLIADDDIKMIIAASGGDYNLEMLPYVDFEAVFENPKWIAGASDPTNLLYPITTHFDIATMYGFNAGTFDWEELHQFQENALEIMTGSIVRQDSFEMYDGGGDFSRPYTEDEYVYWEMINAEDAIEVSGRLIGGCLDCISKLIGTPYDGTPGFIERHRDEGIIWFFDVFAMDADQLYMTLLQMEYAGYFEGAVAVVIGRVCFKGDSETEDYLDRLQRIFDIPVIFNADIGHVKPCFTLINGSYATVNCEDGAGSIDMALI